MEEIKCPKCGEVFQIDETSYAAIVKQVRDSEFAREIKQRENAFAADKQNAVELAQAKAVNQKEKELAESRAEIERLKGEVQLIRAKAQLAVQTAVQEKESRILELGNELDLAKKEQELQAKSMKHRSRKVLQTFLRL